MTELTASELGVLGLPTESTAAEFGVLGFLTAADLGVLEFNSPAAEVGVLGATALSTDANNCCSGANNGAGGERIGISERKGTGAAAATG